MQLEMFSHLNLYQSLMDTLDCPSKRSERVARVIFHLQIIMHHVCISHGEEGVAFMHVTCTEGVALWMT